MKKEIKNKSFQSQKVVNFFLRIHRHLPDKFCGGSPLSNCKYRPDGIPINIANDCVEELQKDPIFRQKEKEVEEAIEISIQKDALKL